MSPATQTPELRSTATATIDPVDVVRSLQRTSPQRATLTAGLILLGLALVSSGAAGLINQVIWQRALKVFLGGAETVCSTVVVLVFMAGLGAGSWWSGRRAARLKNPLSSFAKIEMLLAIVNLGICALLAGNLSQTVFAAQQAAVTLGVPLLLLYAVGASLVLAVPCFLMGATMPLAAEVCQRNFGLRDSRILGWLLFINTAGSVAGAIISSGYMMPYLGLSMSLVLAAALNAVAAFVLFSVRAFANKPAAVMELPDKTNREESRAVRAQSLASFVPTRTDVLALGLGFCSLAYEMHLFRLMPQKQQPLPFTFAAVLTGFLLFWSIGAALSSRLRNLSIERALQLCAALSVLSIAFAAWDSFTPITGVISLTTFVLSRSHFFLPCVLFGFLFARVTEEAAKSWGRDVARIYVWNTVGSCLGILSMTFVGYEIPYFLAIIAVALVVLSLRTCVDTLNEGRISSVPILLAGSIVATCLVIDTSSILPGYRMFCGRDGVITVKENGEMMWDGLWHSSLSDGHSHVGTHNWHLAVMPAICHADEPIKDVCVIGVGTGITAATLAKHESVKNVDAYDISRVLENVFDAYPRGTLNVATDPKVNLIWQDARSGLELNPKMYDIIQTQPLYLKQAGSGLLNSEEFFRLVSKRLKPGGVFCLYSNGTPEQAFIVRETADRVFPYRETFFDGYLAILSNDPIALNELTIENRLAGSDPLWREIRDHEQTKSAAAIVALRDQPELPRHDGRIVITDDFPLVEYPAVLEEHFRRNPLPFRLPAPDSSMSLK